MIEQHRFTKIHRDLYKEWQKWGLIYSKLRQPTAIERYLIEKRDGR